MSERDAISVTPDALFNRLTESWITKRCAEMSDDTKQSKYDSSSDVYPWIGAFRKVC
jgi:hypothetical protein